MSYGTTIPLGRSTLREAWRPEVFAIVETQARQAAERKPRPDRQRVEFQLERLPYCLEGAHRRLADIIRETEALVALCRDRVAPGPATQIALPREELLDLRLSVDSYFDAAVRSQDALVGVIGAVLDKDVPDSMVRLVSGKRRDRSALPASVEHEIQCYWREAGSSLRAYRNAAQHNAVVASEATILRDGDGRVEVAMFLPANPSDRDPSAWKYGSAGVLAYPYCETSYIELLRFSCAVLHLLAQRLGRPRLYSRVITSRASIGPVQPRSYVLPTEQALEHRINDSRVAAETAAEAKYGPILHSA